MEELVGEPGELVDRLVELLNSDALGEGEWYSVSFYADYFLGGRALRAVVPDTGRVPRPGSVGEEMRQRHELVSCERYFELMRNRLNELVRDGLEEAFLVRSVRDAVWRELSSIAEVGKGDRNRAEMREKLEHAAEDPAAIAGFRARVADQDPSAEGLSDEEIAGRLRRMAESEILLPTSADDAVERWAMLTRWDENATALLPDAAFEEWRLRRR